MSREDWTRERAWKLVEEWTGSVPLRGHMRAVELAMRHFAERGGHDVEWWGIVGLLHDFDYERYPNDDHRPDAGHPAAGVAHLASLGFPAEGCDAIMGHAEYTGVPRESELARTLYAVDELCGFVVACGLVRPSRSLADLEVPSVRRKLKDRGFARGVDRQAVTDGAAGLGLPLDELIGEVIAALRPAERELGLGTAG